MKRKMWFGMICLVVFIIIAITPLAIQAQEACSGVYIRNDSGESLDEAAICQAAQSWIGAGFQVYIYLTDYDPPNEDAWFAQLDQIEADFGIRDLSQPDAFSKSAIAFEATTVTSHPWGHNVTLGEMLFRTPLDTDAAIGKIKGQMKNKIAAGDLTSAFVNALEQSYAIAFPPPTPTSKPVPTVVVTGPTTKVSVDLRPVVLFFGFSLLGVALLIGAYLFFTRLLAPTLQKWTRIRNKKQHLDSLARKVDSLLLAAENLFAGTNAEDTTLWKLFALYGGEAYPDLVEQVRNWIRRSMAALQEAFELNDELDQRQPGPNIEDLDAMVKAYEMLYLTLVGTDDRILTLDEEGLRAFIDPMTPVIEAQTSEDQIVDQVRQMREQLADRPLRIQLMIVDLSEVDADGLFGYANRIKAVITQLVEVQEEAPKSLETARQARNQAASSEFPDGLAPNKALAAVNALIAKAEEEQQAGRWLNVKEHAEQAVVLTGKIMAITPEVKAVVSRHCKQEKEVEEIASQGYQLPFFADAQAKCQKIITKMYARISKGELEATRRSIENLADESTNMLGAAQALVQLHLKNEQELDRLAKEVARVENYRLKEVQPAWEVLQAYPQSNWVELEDNFDAATHSIAQLFDNPADEKDLTSEIARINSMETQDFNGAEQMFLEAFASLRQAESQLRSIVEQLAQVRQIEDSIQDLLTATQTDIERAEERRDRDDVKVDVEVDVMIEKATRLLIEARQLAKARELTKAANSIATSRNIANRAYSLADEQAKAVDGLFAQLEKVSTSAKELAHRAKVDYYNLTPVAQRAGTGGMVESATSLLRKAQRAETRITDKEDRALIQALEKTVALYREVEQEATEALQRIAADKEEYDQLVGSTRSAIEAASSAITSANRYVGHSDAGSAGRTSLSQARSGLPSLPTYGSGQDAYRRVYEQAQRAQELAEQAVRQARQRIAEAEAAREAERRRREEERRRQEAERRRQAAAQRAAESARRSSSWSSSSRSSSFGFSSRPSGFGSSSRR